MIVSLSKLTFVMFYKVFYYQQIFLKCKEILIIKPYINYKNHLNYESKEQLLKNPNITLYKPLLMVLMIRFFIGFQTRKID